MTTTYLAINEATVESINIMLKQFGNGLTCKTHNNELIFDHPDMGTYDYLSLALKEVKKIVITVIDYTS